MNKEEIQKEIDSAVKVFKESLEKAYLEKEKAFYGIGMHTYFGALTGKISEHRLNDGSLRISGCLPKILFNEKCKGLPRNIDDYDIYPLVVTLFNKKFEE